MSLAVTVEMMLVMGSSSYTVSVMSVWLKVGALAFRRMLMVTRVTSVSGGVPLSDAIILACTQCSNRTLCNHLARRRGFPSTTLCLCLCPPVQHSLGPCNDMLAAFGKQDGKGGRMRGR